MVYWHSMNNQKGVIILVGLIFVTNLMGCAGTRYEQQADVIKEHVETFYTHLQAHRVDQAVSENQQIEAVALRAEKRLLGRVGQMEQVEKVQEWKIIKTAKETAAENWLALGRYFTQAHQYDKARGTYQRVIETYQSPLYQTYVERAKTGLRDVELILDPDVPPKPLSK